MNDDKNYFPHADSDIEEIVEEKPPMGGAGDDSSSSFLDFPGGGGYDPNQPGSSRDLVPAGNQAVATGAAGQKVGQTPICRAPHKENAPVVSVKKTQLFAWLLAGVPSFG